MADIYELLGPKNPWNRWIQTDHEAMKTIPVEASKEPFIRVIDFEFDCQEAEERAAGVYLHPHTNCPYCNGTLASKADAVSDTELVEWFVREGWRQSKQELVAKLRKDFNVTKKG